MDASQEFKLGQDKTNEVLNNYKAYLMGNVLYSDEWDFLDMPIHADMDKAIALKGEINHFIEVKTRRHNLGYFQQTKISLRKHTFAEHTFKESGIKSYFLCGFLDKTAFLDLTQEPDRVSSMVARHDRGEEEDIYALYNCTRFKVIWPL